LLYLPRSGNGERTLSFHLSSVQKPNDGQPVGIALSKALFNTKYYQGVLDRSLREKLAEQVVVSILPAFSPRLFVDEIRNFEEEI
jgi:hypothetical protein